MTNGPPRTLRTIFRRLFRFAEGNYGFLGLAALLVLGITLTNTAMIWLIGAPLDAIYAQDFAAAKGVLVWFVVFVLLNQGFHVSSNLLAQWIGLRFVGRLRNALFERLLALSYPAANDFGRGDLLARLSDDVATAEELSIEFPLDLVSHAFTFALYTAMLFWIDARLALLAAVFAPLLLLHQRFFAPRKRRVAEKFYDRNGKLLSFEEDALANLRGASSFGAERVLSHAQRRAFEQFRLWSMRDTWLSQFFSGSFSLLIYFPAAIIVFVGLHDIQAGLIGAGELVSFLLYLGYLSVPLSGFARIPFESQGAAAAGERIFHILDALPQVTEKANAQTLLATKGIIALDDLHFGYSNKHAVLRGVHLDIKGGETVALVGPSGSGKTTLAKLLMRFYDPTSGAIRIDGQDLRDVTLNSLRRNISVVWQEPFLINDTLRANLHMANPEASEDAMIAACRDSQAWEFIENLDSGLDTPIGAGGTELSAGQRQRLALAQAFLRDAPILILDEASSALDSHTEKMLVQAVERLRKNRTTLIIAHRYSSIRNADRVVYLNGDGTITTGSHALLLESHAGYQQAVNWQIAASN